MLRFLNNVVVRNIINTPEYTELIYTNKCASIFSFFLSLLAIKFILVAKNTGSFITYDCLMSFGLY